MRSVQIKKKKKKTWRGIARSRRSLSFQFWEVDEVVPLIDKSSHPELFCKIGVFKKILKIHRKTPVPESLFE